MTKPSSEWVALVSRFTPGWPWPESSYGLDPMFGVGGWCRGCGTPLVEQSGPLVIQGRKFPTADVWTPNWLFDVFCVSPSLAADVAARFNVALGHVHKPSKGPTGVMQLMGSPTQQPWFRPEELRKAVIARRPDRGDRTGSECPSCGRWKWSPIGEEEAPLIGSSLDSPFDMITSPERFGSGLASMRLTLFRRPLGETLAAANPRTFSLIEVNIT